MNAGRAVDHLEVWSSAAQLPVFGKHCIDESKLSLSAWSIDTKGAVRRVTGTGKSPRARAIDAPDGSKHFLIERADSGTLTLAYSDSDDGKVEERLIATSKLRTKDPYSLGRLHPISADAARCDVDRGSLVPWLTLGYSAASN